MVDATEMLMEFEEDGGEIDVEDASTIPSDVIDLFASFDESFSESVSNLSLQNVTVCPFHKQV